MLTLCIATRSFSLLCAQPSLVLPTSLSPVATPFRATAPFSASFPHGFGKALLLRFAFPQ